MEKKKQFSFFRWLPKNHRKWIGRWWLLGIYYSLILVLVTALILNPDKVEDKNNSSKKAKESAVKKTSLIIPVFDINRVIKPVEGSVLKNYGWYYDENYGDYRFNNGLEFYTEPGTPVKALGPGKIINVDNNSNGLKVLTIDHGQGWKSKYCNLTDIKIKTGQYIKRGQVLGKTPDKIGSDNFNIVILKNEKSMDPMQYLKNFYYHE